MTKKEKLKNKNFVFLQPVLTIILICLLAFLIFRPSSDNDTDNDDNTQQIRVEVTFDQAVKQFSENLYQITTYGNLLVKDVVQPTTDLEQSSTDTERIIKATGNSYDDMIFYVEKGVLRRLDFVGFGKNDNILFLDNRDIMYVSHDAQSYSIIPEPDPVDSQAVAGFEGSRKAMQEVFPLIPLIEDYNAGKFAPTKVSLNKYVGKWKHPLFTSNEVVDVYLVTDPNTGLFSQMRMVHTFATQFSDIYFVFKKLDDFGNLFQIPTTYENISQTPEYKIKEK